MKNSRVVHTVIKSDRRFTYEEAQEIIETGKGDFKEEVLQLDKLAKYCVRTVSRQEPSTSTATK